MFSSSSKNQPAENTQAQTQNYGVFIAKGAELSGNFSSNTSARIDGVFSGIIYSEEDIVVGESGQLKANVIAKNVTVASKIEGNVVAKNKLEVLAGSSIIGDIRCDQLLVESGALVRGKIGGVDDADAQQSLPPKAAETAE